MIAAEGDVLAALGGWRGDQLFVSRGGGPFRPVAELGWDAAAQATPQRRMLLRGGELLVLEPVAGPFLLPPFRVRRLDLEGRETGREEGEGDAGDAHLHYHGRREARGRWRVVRSGIDPVRGRPVAAEQVVPAEMAKRDACSGRPFAHAGRWWYPVRMGGLLGVADDGSSVTRFRCDPGPPELVGGAPVCAATRWGRPGAWCAGRWRRLAGSRLFAAWRTPAGPLVAPRPGGGLLFLRRTGGALPALDGPPGRLPPGAYAGFVEIGGRLGAVDEQGAPRLVPVQF